MRSSKKPGGSAKSLKRQTKLITFIGLEVIIGIGASFLSFIAFYWLTEQVIIHRTNSFDQIVSQYIQSFRTPVLTSIMFLFTFLGSYMLVFGTVFIASILFWKRKHIESFFFMFIIGVGLLLNLLIKQLIARPRPPHPLYQVLSYSFPSGHSMNSFIFYAILVFGVFHFTRRKRMSLILGIFMLVLVLLIGISRVYLGVHYPSDVIGGFIAGFWWIVTLLLIEKTYSFLRTSEK